MKDFETDKEILGVYILITSSEGKSVTVSPQTFTEEMDKHLKDYHSQRRGWKNETLENFYKEYMRLTYEAKDLEDNLIIRTPLFLPRHGRFFPKTINFFLEQEDIKIN